MARSKYTNIHPVNNILGIVQQHDLMITFLNFLQICTHKENQPRKITVIPKGKRTGEQNRKMRVITFQTVPKTIAERDDEGIKKRPGAL